MSDNFEKMIEILSPDLHEQFLKHYYKTVKVSQDNEVKKLEMQKIRLDENIKLANTAQFYSFLLSLIAILSGSLLVWFSHDIAGAIIASSGFALIGISRFIKMKKKFMELASMDIS